MQNTIIPGPDARQEYLHLWKPAESDGAAVERLGTIIELLRSEDGCPWDKAQTHESLRSCLIEEAYEVCEAIDMNDEDNLEEELGDLLMQIVFHGDLGKNSGSFDLKSISNRVSDKMIRRHPHIFLKENVKTIDNVIEKWENVKRQEKGDVSQTAILESVPKALPALTRSCKIQSKAADVGFDWDHVRDAFQKIEEETEELRQAFHDDDKAALTEELGDLLFSVVNVARFLDIDPEEALNATSQKFVKRFAYIEEAAFQNGNKLEDMTLAEMDELWERAKRDKLK